MEWYFINNVNRLMQTPNEFIKYANEVLNIGDYIVIKDKDYDFDNDVVLVYFERRRS